MIFLTVGTQLPFDRLIKAVDNWAKDHCEIAFFAQIGETQYEPKHMPWCRFMDPEEYLLKFKASRSVISHAGIGTIITSLLQEKPLIIMPRLAQFGEHRNDHQLATVKYFEMKGLSIAYNEQDLNILLDDIDNIRVNMKISQYANENLLAKLSEYIHS